MSVCLSRWPSIHYVSLSDGSDAAESEDVRVCSTSGVEPKSLVRRCRIVETMHYLVLFPPPTHTHTPLLPFCVIEIYRPMRTLLNVLISEAETHLNGVEK